MNFIKGKILKGYIWIPFLSNQGPASYNIKKFVQLIQHPPTRGQADTIRREERLRERKWR
jgi:hypothetical protein